MYTWKFIRLTDVPAVAAGNGHIITKYTLIRTMAKGPFYEHELPSVLPRYDTWPKSFSPTIILPDG